jgi:hypothetical protein
MTPERALVRVTQLYWLTGAIAVGHVCLALLQEGRFPLDLGLFSLWIAARLRAHQPRAWQAARIYTSALIIFLGIVTVAIGLDWMPPASLGIRVFNIQVLGLSRLGVSSVLVSLIVLCLWELQVLQRADVRRLFPDDSRSSAPADQGI